MRDYMLSLVSRWRLDDPDVVQDLGWKGNGNDGSGVNLAAANIIEGIAGRKATRFNGTDERVDCGDVGTIRTISFWVRPDTTTEEIVLLSSGNDIMVNGGTITYTGVSASATYVNGQASTTLAADEWQHVVCVLDADHAASDFRLATDETNYGDIDLDEVMVFNTAVTALQAADLYAATRQGRA